MGSATLACVLMLPLAAVQDPGPVVRKEPATEVGLSRPGRRAVMPKSLANSLPVDARQDRVVLKLVEGRPELVNAGRVAAPDVLAVVGERPILPFFVGLESELRKIRQRQLAATPAGERPPVDLALYFEVHTAGGHETRTLVERLNALATVELSYARELPTPPPGDILPVTPDFSFQQGYRNPPPAGLGALAASSITGGLGAGVKVIDIEWGWDFDHEDIAGFDASKLIGPPIFDNTYNDHGTAVVGILDADLDVYGVSGFTPDADVHVTTNYPSQTTYSVANAIARGLPTLAAGDVLVLEAQTQTPLGLGPTEWLQADFDAILVATGLGIITVEAAGNGGVNLDSALLGPLFQLSWRDSGAILVGASIANGTARATFSCFGSRIDANGWGAWVTTTGYGQLFDPGDIRQRYTASFGGTSSATPMVAGAVVALRGAAMAQLEPTAAAALDGAAIRGLLRAHGTSITGIRNRPDLGALLAGAGIVRGLTVRSEPRTGQVAHIDLIAAAPATVNDFYGFAGAFRADNVPMPGPFSGRLLLDPNGAAPLAFGQLSGSSPSATLAFAIPNSMVYRGLRFHVQGFVVEAATGNLTPTNSVLLHVRR